MNLIMKYQKDDVLRKSMSSLSKEIFGLDFEPLYQSGFWGEGYSNISFEDKGKIVSNVSCYELTVEKNSKKYSAVQLGAVMTHKDYQKQGLARLLMEKAIQNYESKDLIFLFGNETVREFYPRFGFESVKHIKFKQEKFSFQPCIKGRKLNYKDDLELIKTIVFNRTKNSQTDYVYDDSELKMFYLLYLYQDNIYLHNRDIIVIEKDNDVLHVHDFFTDNDTDIDTILGAYVEGIKTINYGFHAKLDGLEAYEDVNSDMFVRTEIKDLLKPWHYPTTSVT